MNSFKDLDLPTPLQNALTKIGFVAPTKVQQKALPPLLEGKDVLACSETGSGKTAAYLLPMLKSLLEDEKAQGLILAPTRELAQQISQFLKTLMPDHRAFPTATLVGGQDIRKQFKSLQKKPRIIVATPGRLIDHLKRNTAQIHKVGFLVLDEGDRMLDMGFEPQLKQILNFLPEKRQTSLFTATIDDRVKALTKKYLNSPTSLILSTPRPVSTIKQDVVKVEASEKPECILNEINERQGSVVVFLKTRRGTDKLNKYLSSFGVSVDLIHGGRTQGQRNRAIKLFKDGKTRVLCATDVAARGIDVPQVEHVINYDLPMQEEDYVHRVGRTARNGADGEAISLVTPNEHDAWNRLVRKYDIPGALLESNKRNHSGRGKTAKKKKFGKKKKSFSRAKSTDSAKNSEPTRKKSSQGKAGAGFKKKSKHPAKASGRRAR